MKVPNGISIPNTSTNRKMYCVKFVKSVWLETIGKNVVQPTEVIPLKQRILK
jgi:hypothetical protein